MLSDFRYSVRGLARSPGLALVLFLTIALGVGANAMVYGFVRGSFRFESTLPAAGQLVSIFVQQSGGEFEPLSANEFTTLDNAQSRATSAPSSLFASVAAFREDRGELEFDGHRVDVAIATSTPSLFVTLGFSAKASATDVFVSRRLWRDVLGGPGKFLDHTVRLNGTPRHVAGILPDQFDGLYAGRLIDVWAESDASDLLADNAGGHRLWTIGRVRAGVTPKQASASIGTTGISGVMALPYSGVEPQVAGGLAKISGILPLAALMVFLVACANIATFLLSRATSRAHETSVRVAIGATRGRISRQLLADALVISIAGTLAGALVAVWASGLIPALFFEQDASTLVFSPGTTVIVLACAISIAITVACGLVPLSEVRDDEPASVLRRESGGLSNAARRVRSSLVVGQVAVSCALVITAALLFQHTRYALKTTLGRQLGDPVIATVTFGGRFALEARGVEFYERAREIATHIGGVTSAEWVSALPGAQASWEPIRLEPLATSSRIQTWRAESFPPTPVSKFVVTKVKGRVFGGRDAPGGCPVVMLNRSAAEILGDDPIGRVIEDPVGRAAEVIGVVDVDAKDGAVPTKDARAASVAPTIFYYREQREPPVQSGSSASFRVPAAATPASRMSLNANVVSPSYLDSVGAELVSGVSLSPDMRAADCRVALVNTVAEERFFGGHAVGRSFYTAAGNRVSVVGVVKTSPLRILETATEPTVFYPMAQQFLARMTMLIGTSRSGADVALDLRHALGTLPDQLYPPTVMPLDEHMAMTSQAPARLVATLIAVLALLAIALSSMGVYGAMADAVRQRRRELALRVALGAQRWRLALHVFSDAARVAVVGAVCGAGLAGGVERYLLPAPVGERIWPAWVAAPAILAAIVVLAALIPARRAVGADPLSLMKES